ncbi:MAG: hypothetical protein C0615_09345 [Desulfuromonas sp.]|nr:MAG: hypothetical protein C0615_09345 [Desulfuromonas sp.]
MEMSKQTKGEQHIEQLMQNLDPGSERYRVLDSARQFKASWVELGEQLVTVSRDNLFSEWGYSTFEEYCSREIRIRKQTAAKLTLAFGYLQRKEPAVLDRDELRPAPDYRSIDLLRRAEEEEEFSEKECHDLRQAVIEEGRSLPTIQKRFRESVQSRQSLQEGEKQALKAALSSAKRLESLLAALPETGQEIRPLLADLIRELGTAVELHSQVEAGPEE